MLEHSMYLIIISKIFSSLFFSIDRFLSLNRDRILAALAKVDPSIDPNQLYSQVIRSLSLPLNRLEKYACLLKEYLHNLEVISTILF